MYMGRRLAQLSSPETKAEETNEVMVYSWNIAKSAGRSPQKGVVLADLGTMELKFSMWTMEMVKVSQQSS